MHDVKTHFANPQKNIAFLGVEHGMKVADFGAGSGAYTLAIAEHLSGSGRVYAIDIQKNLLRRISSEAIKRGLKNIEVVWGDLEIRGSSKIQDHVIDVVLISNTLFQIPDKKNVLEEAARVVKKNGKVVVIDWSESFDGLGPHPDDVCPQSAVRALASQIGLTCIEEFDAGAHHYGLVFAST